MSTTTPEFVRHELRAATPLPAADLVGLAALAAVVAIHTTDLADKVAETTYLGLGYVLLIAASLVSVVLLARRDRRGWLLGGLTCAATVAGFVVTRTTGLPGAMGDRGNWGEPLAVWSLAAEGLFLVLAALAVARERRHQ